MATQPTRQDFLKNAAITAGGTGAALGMLTMFGVSPAAAAQHMEDVARGKRLKAAFSNAGLQATWCAQGRDAAMYWGNIMGVDVTWYDGQLDAAKQLTAIDDMAAKSWDFVAIQAFGISTLTNPVSKMISAGIPVVDMDTQIAPPGTLNLHTTIAPDNEFMGTSVAQALFNAMGGKGNIIETWGAYGHTGAQGRNRGLKAALKNNPGIKLLDSKTANWDVTQVQTLWNSWIVKYGDKINGGFFHNDDMALAAYQVIKQHGLAGKIKIVGVDAMPPAINAVLTGAMAATVRNPSCRVHGYALFAGVAAALNGEKTGSGIPKNIVADGPVVTPNNAEGMLWMEKHFVL